MTDPRERTRDPQVGVQVALDGRQAQIWTCLPGILQSFNATKMTCVVQPTIQGQFRNQKGKWQNQTMPPCVDCPVVFPGGGPFLMTFPLTAGDEVLIYFSSRCIDGWWQSGQVSPQAVLRMHDLSDGFVSPKLYSMPNVPGGVSTTDAQLRSKDGTASISITPAGAINIVAPGGFNVTAQAGAHITAPGGATITAPTTTLDGNTTMNGNQVLNGSFTGSGAGGGEMNITGNVNVTGEVTANNIPLSGHAHSGVQTGGGDSGPPIP